MRKRLRKNVAICLLYRSRLQQSILFEYIVKFALREHFAVLKFALREHFAILKFALREHFAVLKIALREHF